MVPLCCAVINTIWLLMNVDRNGINYVIFLRLTVIVSMRSLFVWNRDKINSLLEEIFKMTTNADLKKLQTYDIVLSALISIYYIFAIVRVKTLGDKVGGIHKLGYLFFGTDQFPVPMTFLYYAGFIWAALTLVQVCAALYVWITIAIRLLIQECLKNLDQLSPQQAIRTYVQLNGFRRQLNNALGHVPFIPICHFFISISLVVTDLLLNQEHYKKSNYRIWATVELLTLLTVNLIILWFATSTSRSLFELFEAIKTKIGIASNDFIRNTRTTKHISVLAINPVCDATANGMFVLDQGFIVRFLGALISFVVMVISTVQQLRN